MKTSIGEYCTITDDVEFGVEVVIHGHCNLYGCRIGDGSRVGTFVEIQSNTSIGKRVRVQSHSFICSDIVIEDDVFIGHNVNFINDRYPTAHGAASRQWNCEGTHVSRGASIGTGAVILCGITIGEGAVIGAGSVVTRNVAAHTVVAGNPARILRAIPPDEQWHGGTRG